MVNSSQVETSGRVGGQNQFPVGIQPLTPSPSESPPNNNKDDF